MADLIDAVRRMLAQPRGRATQVYIQLRSLFPSECSAPGAKEASATTASHYVTTHSHIVYICAVLAHVCMLLQLAWEHARLSRVLRMISAPVASPQLGCQTTLREEISARCCFLARRPRSCPRVWRHTALHMQRRTYGCAKRRSNHDTKCLYTTGGVLAGAPNCTHSCCYG